MRSRTAKRPGPLLHQQRLHSARLHRRDVAQEQASGNFYAAIQGLKSPQDLLDARQQAHVEALKAFDNAKEQVLAQQALVSAQQSMADLSLAGPRAPRPISITDLDDRIVIEVGRTELRLTREEAARLFAMGRDFGGKPQA